MEGYYVYIHRKENNGEVFYIGTGTKMRAWDFWNRNECWKKIYEAHGCEVEIVQSEFSEKYDAVFLETELQKEYKPEACLQYGAGEYTVISETTRKKHSENTKGSNNPMYGKKHTEECKQKMSKKKKGKKGRRQYDWEIENLIERNKRAIINCRGQIFDSLLEAHKLFGLTTTSSISQQLNGKQKTAGRYPDGNKVKWEYYNGENNG